MKNSIIFSLLFFLSYSCLQAQNESSGKPKSKVIIKKITVENINGKEIEKEEIDTIEISDMKYMSSPDKNIEVIIKDDSGKNNDENIIFMRHPEESDMNLDELETDQRELSPNKAVLGVLLDNVEGENGAQITEIFDGSAAEKIGLMEGDIILSIDNKETRNVDDVISSLSDNKVGDKVKITFLREAKIKTAKATLQQRKEETIKMKNCHSNLGDKKNHCCKSGSSGSGLNECIIIKDKDGKVISHDIKGNSKINKKIIILNNDNEEIKLDEPNLDKIEMNDDLDHSIKEIGIRTNESQNLNVEYLASSPNPSNGHMKINFSGLKVPTTIKVLDLNGKEIYTEKLDNFDGTYNKEINIKNEARGTLILKIIQGDKIISQKLIVE